MAAASRARYRTCRFRKIYLVKETKAAYSFSLRIFLLKLAPAMKISYAGFPPLSRTWLSIRARGTSRRLAMPRDRQEDPRVAFGNLGEQEGRW